MPRNLLLLLFCGSLILNGCKKLEPIETPDEERFSYTAEGQVFNFSSVRGTIGTWNEQFQHRSLRLHCLSGQNSSFSINIFNRKLHAPPENGVNVKAYDATFHVYHEHIGPNTYCELVDTVNVCDGAQIYFNKDSETFYSRPFNFHGNPSLPPIATVLVEENDTINQTITVSFEGPLYEKNGGRTIMVSGKFENVSYE